MAVYYFEGLPIATPLTISSNEPMFDVDLISLKKQRTTQGSQRWELSFTTVGTDASALFASVADFDSTGTMPMPQVVDLTTANYPAGAFVEGNQSGKIYMVKADASTIATSNVYPDPTGKDTTFSTPANATLTYYRDINSLQGITFTDGVLSSAGSITLIEAV